MTGSLLQQHITVPVEEENAERPMQSNTVVVHFVAIAFARKTNVFIARIDENAIFLVEKVLLLLRLDGFGEIVRWSTAETASSRHDESKTIHYRHDTRERDTQHDFVC